MDDSALEKLGNDISREITRGYGLKGPLDRQLRKLGRRLPRAQARAAKLVVEAQSMRAHPKLARQIDEAAVEAAGAKLLAFLAEVDPAERRKGTVLSVLGSISLGLLVLSAAVVGVVVWRGLV